MVVLAVAAVLVWELFVEDFIFMEPDDEVKPLNLRTLVKMRSVTPTPISITNKITSYKSVHSALLKEQAIA